MLVYVIEVKSAAPCYVTVSFVQHHHHHHHVFCLLVLVASV